MVLNFDREVGLDQYEMKFINNEVIRSNEKVIVSLNVKMFVTLIQ